ncbi:MAG TPA: copper chaperone PCu(A)C [Xanthobacteraceae bacterium]|jgi:copper(I)-binding protein
MRTAVRLLFLFAFAFVAIASAASAHEFEKGSVLIDHPWSRATPHGAPVAAGYLVIENRGSNPERLVSVSVSPDLAGRAEIHEMAMQDGVMKMRPLPRGVEIAPGFTMKFEPGGLHLMFVDLKRPLVKGDRFKATLTFEQAGAIEVEFVVEAMGGQPQHMSH